MQYTKWSKNLPNDHKMQQITKDTPNDHDISQHFPFQDRPKFTQIGSFCTKKCHLATLARICASRKGQMLHRGRTRNSDTKEEQNKKLKLHFEAKKKAAAAAQFF
jgi:hypothetical protein